MSSKKAGVKRTADSEIASSDAGPEGAKRARRPSSKIAEYNDAEIDAILKEAELDTTKKGGKKPGRPPKDHALDSAESGAEAGSAPKSNAGPSGPVAVTFSINDILQYQQLLVHYTQLHVASQSLVLQAQPPTVPAHSSLNQATQINSLVAGALQLLHQVMGTPAAQAAIAAATAQAAGAAADKAGAAAAEGAGEGH